MSIALLLFSIEHFSSGALESSLRITNLCECADVFFGEHAVTHHKFGAKYLCICANVQMCFPVCSNER